MSKTKPPSWDERYGSEAYVYGTEPNAFLAEHAGRITPGGRVLSLGEGEGRNGVYLARRGLRVVGIDGSSVGLAKARKLADAAGVSLELLQGDLNTLEFPTEIDAVVAIFCHLPSAQRRAVHRRAEASLRSGGFVLIESYGPAQPAYATGGPKDTDMLVTPDDLVGDFAACDVVLARALVREVREGLLHTGTAAVTQGVFRKR